METQVADRSGIAGIIAVVQLALASGAPLGKAAWGGRNDGVLPSRLRIASGPAAIVTYEVVMV